MATRKRRFRFTISESFTPDTLPMARLAEYMWDIATLLGEKDNVHFVGLETGSVGIVEDVDWQAVPKVRDRVRRVRRNDAPPDAQRAYETLNRRLADDNTSGYLIEERDPGAHAEDLAPSARILEFPGIKRHVQPEYGPFNQPSTLQGTIIVIGGVGDPVPVHIEDGDVVHLCQARRRIAREFGSHIFGPPIRVFGTARWSRDAEGTWVMRNFTIESHTVLRDETAKEAFERLQALPGKWKERPDPLGQLERIRGGGKD